MHLRVFVTIEQETIRLPVRSAIYKQCTGGLVVRWVTTSESPLLYVFEILFAWIILITQDSFLQKMGEGKLLKDFIRGEKETSRNICPFVYLF